MRGRAAAAVQTGSTTVVKTLFFLFLLSSHYTLSLFGHRLVELGETSVSTDGFQSSFVLRVKNIIVRNFVQVQKARSKGNHQTPDFNTFFPTHDRSPFRVGDFLNGRLEVIILHEFSCFIFFAGLRKVYPYYFTLTTFTKGRWVEEKILDVFAREFRAHPVEEYVRTFSPFFSFFVKSNLVRKTYQPAY